MNSDLNRTGIVQHRYTCQAPDVIEKTGRHGDTMRQCRTCGKFAFVPIPPAHTVSKVTVPDASPPAPEHPTMPAPLHVAAPTPQSPPPMALTSSWQCRTHPYVAVNWKGKGCTPATPHAHTTTHAHTVMTDCPTWPGQPTRHTQQCTQSLDYLHGSTQQCRPRPPQARHGGTCF